MPGKNSVLSVKDETHSMDQLITSGKRVEKAVFQAMYSLMDHLITG